MKSVGGKRVDKSSGGDRDSEQRRADRSEQNASNEDRLSKPLDRAGSPGRTPGNAEGDRSDIEEWLKEDSKNSNRPTE